jgi:hypothetical protein
MKEKEKDKHTLVKIGRHYIDPNDVMGIKCAKDGLYIIVLRSDPEPRYPLWLKERDFEHAKEHFNIIGE